MLWKIAVVLLATIVALLIASSIWSYLFIGSRPGYATDATLFLHSPYWWLINAVIVGTAGWLLKHWLFVPKR